MKRVGIYLRVSTNGQTTENQRRELVAIAARSGWQVIGIYEDAGISGAKGRDKRPGFDKLYRAIVRHQFDIVAASSVDRLGRSLQDLVGFLGEVHAAGVDLYLDRQGVDTSTPAGKALFQMLGVFAEFERSIIQERIAAGIARARAKGTRSGKAFGQPKAVGGARGSCTGRAGGRDGHSQDGAARRHRQCDRGADRSGDAGRLTISDLIH